MKSVAVKKSFDYDLIAMAYHESSHTVIGLHNYLMVYNVSVMTFNHQEGITEYFYYPFDDVQNKKLLKELLILDLQEMYAGLIGEKIYYKNMCGSDKFPMHLRIGSSEDIKNASKQIKKYKLVNPGSETHLFKKQIQEDTKKLLLEHWEAVQVIAHALYKKTRLSFDDLKFLLTRKTSNKEFWKDRFKKLKIIHSGKVPTEQEVKDIVLP